MWASGYEPGIKTIHFYMKLPLTLYKAYWNTTVIARNTSADNDS